MCYQIVLFNIIISHKEQVWENVVFVMFLAVLVVYEWLII